MNWTPHAIIVLVIAVAVSLAHVIAVVILAWHGKSVGEVGGDVLIAVVGAMIAIVAGYVGRYENGGKGPDTRPEQSPDTRADQTDGPGLQRPIGTDQEEDERRQGP